MFVKAVAIPINPRILFSLEEASMPHLLLRFRERAPSRSSIFMGPAGTVGRLNSAGDSLLPFSSPSRLRGPRGILFVPVMEPLLRQAMVDETDGVELKEGKCEELQFSLFLITLSEGN